MKNHKEMFEALLAGETLESYSREYKLIEGKVHSLDITDCSDGRWVELHKPPHYESVKVRPKTININAFEVPEPCRVPPSEGVSYYMPYPNSKNLYRCLLWNDDEYDTSILQKGILHLTKEAAIQHAKALLSFTSTEK